MAKYILENPVRAGLAKALGEWPLAGSSVYTWPELLTAWEQQTRSGSNDPIAAGLKARTTTTPRQA